MKDLNPSVLVWAFALGVLPLAVCCSGLEESVDDNGVEVLDAGEDAPHQDTTDEAGYRYVLVEDTSLAVGVSLTPGAALDAVRLKKRGRIVYATKLEDYFEPNPALRQVEQEPSACLGEPDYECVDYEKVWPLGGVGGYVVVSFGEEALEAGDFITAVGDGNDDDNCAFAGVGQIPDVRLSVSKHVDLATFVVVSENGGALLENLP